MSGNLNKSLILFRLFYYPFLGRLVFTLIIMAVLIVFFPKAVIAFIEGDWGDEIIDMKATKYAAGQITIYKSDYMNEVIGDFKKGARIEVTGKVDALTSTYMFRVKMSDGKVGYVKGNKLLDRPVGKLEVVDKSKLKMRGLNPGVNFRDCDICPEMVVIPKGKFILGKNGRWNYEERQVTFKNHFAIGKFEITFDNWLACAHEGICAANSSPDDAGFGRGQHPVINVSYSDIQDYVKWLRLKTGRSYRLPSEAEWEYVMTRGVQQKLTSPDPNAKFLCKYGNVRDLDYKIEPGMGDGPRVNCKDGVGDNTTLVGQYQPNRLGVHDMFGNVSEFVADCFHNSYKGNSVTGAARLTGFCNEPVHRGSSFFSEIERNIPTERGTWGLDTGTVDIGFRVAMDITEPEKQNVSEGIISEDDAVFPFKEIYLEGQGEVGFGTGHPEGNNQFHKSSPELSLGNAYQIIRRGSYYWMYPISDAGLEPQPEYKLRLKPRAERKDSYIMELTAVENLHGLRGYFYAILSFGKRQNEKTISFFTEYPHRFFSVADHVINFSMERRAISFRFWVRPSIKHITIPTNEEKKKELEAARKKREAEAEANREAESQWIIEEEKLYKQARRLKYKPHRKWTIARLQETSRKRNKTENLTFICPTAKWVLYSFLGDSGKFGSLSNTKAKYTDFGDGKYGLNMCLHRERNDDEEDYIDWYNHSQILKKIQLKGVLQFSRLKVIRDYYLSEIGEDELLEPWPVHYLGCQYQGIEDNGKPVTITVRADLWKHLSGDIASCPFRSNEAYALTVGDNWQFKVNSERSIQATCKRNSATECPLILEKGRKLSFYHDMGDKLGAQDIFWATIKNSKKATDFQSFLSKYPNGKFAELAASKIKQLKETNVAIVVSPNNKIVRRSYKPGDSFKDCDDCPEMMVVPPGTFNMGKWESKEPGGSSVPGYKVTIAKKFAVGKFEVTRSQFAAFIKATGYDTGNECWTNKDIYDDYPSEGSYANPGFHQEDDHPVVCVSWIDAKAYVQWLSRKTGKTYRLLSEAEWEYVARAGTESLYWWGNSISSSQANFDGVLFDKEKVIYGENRKKTVSVDSFKANKFGLYNVHGNVSEWVEDCYHYGNAPEDGRAELEECRDFKKRFIRGGAWNQGYAALRSVIRKWRYRNDRSNTSGFRVARTLAD